MAMKNSWTGPSDTQESRRDLRARRRFLRGLASAALAAPILPLFRGEVKAQGGVVPPKNLILVYHQNGMEDGWAPRMSNGELVLGERLAPLAPVKDRLVSIHGIQNSITNEVFAHNQGPVGMWTGFSNKNAASDKEYSPYPSIDQLVARRISTGLRFPSLEFGLMSQHKNAGGGANGDYTIYQGGSPAQPIAMEDDPNRMYERVFGGLFGDPAVLQAARAKRKSVLDFLAGDLGRIQSAYGVEERPKVEAHLASIRAIEERLDRGLGAACTDTFDKTFDSRDITIDERVEAVAALQMDLIVLALQCEVTRVASLQMFSSLSLINVPGVLTRMGVHGIMHAGAGSERRIINTWFAGRVAQLAQKLEASAEPSGRTLLDDTLIVWSSDMAIGNHLNFPVPFFLLGGGKPDEGFFRFGHYQLSRRARHTRALLSVLAAFGITGSETLGDFSDEMSRGPLDDIHRVK